MLARAQAAARRRSQKHPAGAFRGMSLVEIASASTPPPVAVKVPATAPAAPVASIMPASAAAAPVAAPAAPVSPPPRVTRLEDHPAHKAALAAVSALETRVSAEQSPIKRFELQVALNDAIDHVAALDYITPAEAAEFLSATTSNDQRFHLAKRAAAMA